MAGIMTGTFDWMIRAIPGLIILLPGVLSSRGNIFGAFSSKVGTLLHIGEIEPNRSSRQFAKGAFLRTNSLGLYLALILSIMAALFVGEGTFQDRFLYFSAVTIITALISGTFLFLFTMLIAFKSFKRGWDPDTVTVPSITTIGDLTAVPLFFLVAWWIDGLGTTSIHILGSMALLILGAFMISFALRAAPERSSIRGAIKILTVTTLLAVIAGALVENVLDTSFQYGVFLILLIPFNGKGGNFGAILGTRLSTSFYLGELDIRRVPSREVLETIGALCLMATFIFSLVAILAHGISGPLSISSPGLATLLIISLTAGLVLTIGATLLSYYLVVASHYMGLDPDDVVIPLMTSMADLMGTALLIGITFLFLG